MANDAVPEDAELGSLAITLRTYGLDYMQARHVLEKVRGLLDRATRPSVSASPVAPETVKEAVPTDPKRKHSFTLNLTDEELDALEALAEKQRLTPWRVLIQGLRRYQLLVNGEPDLGPMLPPGFPSPASPSRPVEADMVLVPQSALDWLFGSGPDASGKWFGESEDAFPTIKSLGDKPPRYWWRAHFRSLVPALAAASPAQAKEGKDV